MDCGNFSFEDSEGEGRSVLARRGRRGHSEEPQPPQFVRCEEKTPLIKCGRRQLQDVRVDFDGSRWGKESSHMLDLVAAIRAGGPEMAQVRRGVGLATSSAEGARLEERRDAERRVLELRLSGSICVRNSPTS